MLAMCVKTLFGHRELLMAWTMRIVRGRYQQSILGGLWAIIQPAAGTAIFSIIFSRFVPINTGEIPYVVFSYVAMVPWTLFSGSITDMVDSLVNNMNLIGKIYFPREVLPIAASLARLLDFTLAGGILVLLILLFRLPIFFLGWIYIPVILITQLAFALGLGLAGSALNVFYRDIRHLFLLGLQIWFYASPIIYPVSAVPEKFRPFYFLNPVAGVIEAYRAVLLYQTFPGTYLTISVVSAIVTLLSGYWFFKRVELHFADVI